MDQTIAMTESIDLILVTGYLGAGKTTFVNHLLQLPAIMSSSPALIINEFGQQGIDGGLIQAGGRPLFEINSGSLFCVCTTVQFIDVLTKISDGMKPGVVLIEATGIAETRDIEKYLDDPVLCGRFRVRANLCLIDGVNFTKVAPLMKAARSQAAAADAFIVNKTDLAAVEDISTLNTVLEGINPRAKRVNAEFGRIDEEFLNGVTHIRAAEAIADSRSEALYAESFRSDVPVDRDEFFAALDGIGEHLLRLKGYIRFSDTNVPEFVESICGRVTLKPSDKVARSTAFTAIVFDLPPQAIRDAFNPFL
jgi:G3E family GTPase